VTSLYQHPVTGVLYAATYGDGIYKLNTEFSETWEPADYGLSGLAQYVTYISFDVNSEGTIYACTHKDCVYKSTDSGASWSPLPFPASVQAEYPPMAYFLEVDPNNSQSIWVGAAPGSNYQNQTPFYKADEDQGLGGLYHSYDSGETWEQTLYDFGGYRLTIDPVKTIMTSDGECSQSLYLAYIGGKSVLKSEDGGQSFTTQTEGLKGAGVNCFLQSPEDPSMLFAGGQFGIAFSFDKGDTWDHTPITDQKGAYTWSMIQDPFNTDRIYYAVGEPAWNWPENKGLYVLNTDDLELKTDGSSLPGQQIPSTQGIGIWEAYYLESGDMYLATQDEGILTSKDQGDTWNSLSVGLEQKSVSCIAFDHTDSIAYAGTRTYNGKPEWFPDSNEEGGLYSWDSELRQWENIAQGQITTAVFDVHISPSDGQTIFVGTIEGLFVSRDGGTTWEKKEYGLRDPLYVSGIEIDPRNTDRIYVSTWYNGVFVSVDGGEVWTKYNHGLPYHRVQEIALSHQDKAELFASTLGAGICKCQTGQAPVIDTISVNSVPLESPFTLTITEMEETQVVISAHDEDSSELTYQAFWGGWELPPPDSGTGLGQYLNFDPNTGTLFFKPQYGHAGFEDEITLLVSDGAFAVTADLTISVEKSDDYRPTIDLKLNAQSYLVGDLLKLSADFTNPSAPCKLDFYLLLNSEDGFYEQTIPVFKQKYVPHGLVLKDVPLLQKQIGRYPYKDYVFTGVLVQTGQGVQDESCWLDSDAVYFTIID
jgi:photosystem II stability/assembly factor-like uncharacterized protein